MLKQRQKLIKNPLQLLSSLEQKRFSNNILQSQKDRRAVHRRLEKALIKNRINNKKSVRILTNVKQTKIIKDGAE